LHFINHLGAFIGPIFLVLFLISGIVSPIGMGKAIAPNANEKINLNITSTFSLDNTSTVEFIRDFSLSQKREVSLRHIKCQATEDTVKNVLVNVTINGITTSKLFKDSTSSSSSPHTFLIGTTLTLRIDSSTPIFVLSNSIQLEITVESKAFFNTEKGNFQIQKVEFEVLTPPFITSTSENIELPLEISQGTWYVSPLSMLIERQLESEIYAHIMEDTSVRIDVKLHPSDLPLSQVEVVIFTPNSAFESTDRSTSHSILAKLAKGDILTLNLGFRPSSEFSESVISVALTVAISILPPMPNNNSPESSSDTTQLNLSSSVLEIIRFLVIVVPLFIFYKTKKNKQTLKNRSVTTSEN
jgi:hypothetical protein